MRPRRKATWATRLFGLLAIACFGGAAVLWGCSEARHADEVSAAPVAALLEVDDAFSESASGDATTPGAQHGAQRIANASDAAGANARSVAAASERARQSWERAQGLYPGVAAWVVVEGTAVSSPVMQATSNAPNYYLNHNAWGYTDATGLPYLDARSSATEPVRILYGHNLGWGSSERLSPLADAWQEGAFSELGEATWAVPGMRSERFAPLCALKVASTDAGLLSFDLSSEEVPAWLGLLLAKASAKVGDAEALASEARDALVLITCTNGVHPANDRSVVVFVR